MKSIKVNLMFWLAGFVAGIVLLERWRRHGGRYVPVPDGMEGEVVVSSRTVTSTMPASSKPKTSALIIAGAKADADAAKRFLMQKVPSRSDHNGEASPSAATS